MMKIKISLCLFPLLVSAMLFGQNENAKVQHDLEVELQAEYRYFMDNPAFDGQKDHFPSMATRPEYSMTWNEGYETIQFKGFFRLDVDDERTHWDIRELYYQKTWGSLDLSIGAKKVFWGVAESNHLVDIINQTDAVESFDGEQKLGQPMIQASYITDGWGTFDFFYLPFHRKRTFAGEKGRFRFPIVIDKDDLAYESGAEEWRQDFALRWKHYVGAFDIGLSHFFGNGREPLFSFDERGSINAFYPVIHQTGLDAQITHDAFLWKFEAIYRYAETQDFLAIVAGLEYTFGNIDGNGLDIGVLGEYLYDGRNELALKALQNDVFFGGRIALNDVKSTQLLFGGILDLEKSSKIFSLEGSRRLGNSWKLEVEGRFFSSIAEDEFILSNFNRDSFLRFTLFKYF